MPGRQAVRGRPELLGNDCGSRAESERFRAVSTTLLFDANLIGGRERGQPEAMTRATWADFPRARIGVRGKDIFLQGGIQSN